jgi:hypothetical protein
MTMTKAKVRDPVWLLGRTRVLLGLVLLVGADAGGSRRGGEYLHAFDDFSDFVVARRQFLGDPSAGVCAARN